MHPTFWLAAMGIPMTTKFTSFWHNHLESTLICRDFPPVESQNNRAGRLIYRPKCKFFTKHNDLSGIARQWVETVITKEYLSQIVFIFLWPNNLLFGLYKWHVAGRNGVLKSVRWSKVSVRHSKVAVWIRNWTITLWFNRAKWSMPGSST